MNEDELEEERIHSNAMYADEDEVAYLQEYEENMKSYSGVLPAAVKAFQEDACNVAHYNDIPAAASFL